MSSEDEKLAQSREHRPAYDVNSAQSSSGPIVSDIPQMPMNNRSIRIISNGSIGPLVKPWSPVTLRSIFYIPLLLFMIAAAVALEVALHFSQKKNGWATLPPVGVAMVIVALWAWTDLDIRRQQPYIDLARGNAPASKSLLLDYSGKHPALVTYNAMHHNHYIVAISSILVLIGLALQPLAAALFTVKSVYGNGPDLTVTNLQTPGLVDTFSDFTAFYIAAGFTGSSILYNVSPPQFVNEDWVIAALTLPDTKVISNGTLSARTTGVHSLANCEAPDTINLDSLNGTSFTLTGSSGDCNASIPITTAGVFPSVQANIVGATCAGSGSSSSVQFGPVAFWTFFQQANDGQAPQTSLVFCRPTISVMNVQATVQLPTGQLIDVTPISNFSSNITDPNGPLNGQPLNGVVFNLTGADPGTIMRSQATRTALSTAIIIQTESLPGGLQAQLSNQAMMVNTTQLLYQRYMSTAAKENYFLPQQSTLRVTTMTFVSRLFIVLVHYFHARSRDRVILLREPGTIASAAAYTARSNIADFMDPYADGAALNRLLKDKRFRIDKATGRIVMEGDYGYDDLLSPVNGTHDMG
ncbi:hypothetical protein Clacol_009495 [Clathrus columnatus]|uniref:Uncharacterized protein n=1 Tax=Clathrus columnatus TaxID=1419009 RepID=A0AAV5AR68_9AGAM|nr:hypothetical protein Clacol_009495 [Clathrus columnatus]